MICKRNWQEIGENLWNPRERAQPPHLISSKQSRGKTLWRYIIMCNSSSRRPLLWLRTQALIVVKIQIWTWMKYLIRSRALDLWSNKLTIQIVETRSKISRSQDFAQRARFNDEGPPCQNWNKILNKCKSPHWGNTRCMHQKRSHQISYLIG